MAEEMPAYEFQERLQDYLNGELSEKERTAFEFLLRQSADAQAEHQFSKHLRIAQEQSDAVVASHAIRQSIAKEGWPPPAPPKTGLPKWGIGLAIALLLSTALVLSWQQYRQQQERSRIAEISSNYLVPLENVLMTDERASIQLANGLRAYQAGDYALAAELLAAYNAATTDRNSQLYLGVSLLLSGDEAGAEQSLKAVQEKAGEGPVAGAATWYLALLNLQRGNLVEGRQLLEAARQSPFYQTEAEQLLDLINGKQ